MLFHVVMRHTPDNCPAYHTEHMPEVIASLEKLPEVGKELKVKTHALLWGAPAHIAFAVLEADNMNAIGRYLNSIAITQDFDITPVENMSDVIKYAKAVMEQKKKGKSK